MLCVNCNVFFQLLFINNKATTEFVTQMSQNSANFLKEL